MSSPGVPITDIHVISSNHFDAGYASVTSDVINTYFDLFFPRAASVGNELLKRTGQPLRWMTFSYIVSLYLDCPDGFLLHCPTPEAISNFTAAVKAGHIWWSAFPTNAELAAADSSTLMFGVRLSNDTSDRLGVSRSHVLTTRDVPGMPRSAIPVLRAAGIRGLAEGMNGRMVPINVPPAFNWHDEQSNTSLFTMWHWGGYGMPSEPGRVLRLPGSGHVLAYNWRGDNAGPPVTADEIIAAFAELAREYPRARVRSSTFDLFHAAIVEDGADRKLPTVSVHADHYPRPPQWPRWPYSEPPL